MATITLHIKVSGEKEIDAEFQAFQKELAKEVTAAMNDVGSDMQLELASHIQDDVYDAYSPKKYQRRGNGGGLIAQAQTAKIYNHGAGVSLEYKPSGAHSNPDWHTADANDLISRIETKDPPYFKRAQAKVPPRPFWQNFVNEMVDGGALEDSFVRAMLMQGEDVVADGNLTRDANDGVY